jgi:hypothetical protein
MFGALFSFLGGSVFRMIWGEVSSFITARQQHAQEIERMKVQAQLDAETHARNMEAIKLQADLGVKTIQAQAEATASQLDMDAWVQSVKDVGKTTGIKFLDIWNGSVRPALATMSLMVIVFEVVRNGFALNDWDRELVGAILGMYVADRALAHRGK